MDTPAHPAHAALSTIADRLGMERPLNAQQVDTCLAIHHLITEAQANHDRLTAHLLRDLEQDLAGQRASFLAALVTTTVAACGLGLAVGALIGRFWL
jgi:hypothetical protein